MKILGKVQKKEVVKQCYRPVTKVVCDICEKQLKGELYAYVTTSHSRWGNDSCDSIESHDMCFACAKKFFNDYASKPEHTDNFEYEVRLISELKEDVEVQSNGKLYIDDIGSCEIDDEDK